MTTMWLVQFFDGDGTSDVIGLYDNAKAAEEAADAGPHRVPSALIVQASFNREAEPYAD